MNSKSCTLPCLTTKPIATTACLLATLVSFALVPVASAEDSAKAVELFNGKDLTGWTGHLRDKNAKKEDVWSVQEGILICKGKPMGYLRTEKEYQDYVLTLQWRWKPGGKGGNNGVLVHSGESLGTWPKSIEVQLHSGNAGDFWIIGTELDVENEGERKKGRRHLNLTDNSEKPVGQWNTMEITCRGDEIVVKVNGETVNHATNCSVTRGAISLQSEGTECHFRNIQLEPLTKK